MEKKNDLIKDFFSVGFSNFIVLLSGIITGFVVPIILGVDEYGYFKIYTLYLTYTALLHFGFVDGILLSFAGKKYDELNKNDFRTFTSFFVKFQIIIGFLIIFFSFLFINSENKLIFILMGIDATFLNITTYFQYVSQSTLRFKELSVRKISLAILKVLLVFLLIILQKVGLLTYIKAWMYILGLVLIDASLLIIYLKTYKDIIFGTRTRLKYLKKDIIHFFKIGFLLTISFQVSHLIFALDRQFVSSLFDINTYAVYAFAYNLISIITSIISALSLVLFPRLKQKNKDQILCTYENTLVYISIFALGAVLLFLPMSMVIRKFLNNYVFSINYLKIIFPGLALNCCISIVIFTYYKSLELIKPFFKISCLVLLIAIVTNTIAYINFKSPQSISIASIVTMILWYCICCIDFNKRFNIKWYKNFSYIILLMSFYYLISFILNNDLLIFIIYGILYMIITFAFYKAQLVSLKKILFKIIKKDRVVINND